MVLECASVEQAEREFAEAVQTIWKEWSQGSQQQTTREQLEAIRKEQLMELRVKYLPCLAVDTMVQIMREEAEKYNYVNRSK